MKIGLITYHRSHNYGAMLQAAALTKVLFDLKHDVRIIDYWPLHQSKIYVLFDIEEFKNDSFKAKLYYLWIFLRSFIPKIIRRIRFNSFYRDHICPFCEKGNDTYDVIVYGSDQIWRKQACNEGYNPIYFGLNNYKKRLNISYAASAGKLPDNIQDEKTFLEYVKNIDNISVRECDLKLFLENHGFKNVFQTLDPTFLLTQKEWNKISIHQNRLIKEPYLLLYDLQCNCFCMDEVIKTANTMGLRIVQLVGTANRFSHKYYRTTDGPYEFLNLVKYADFVFTSSYHGLAFSIIFNRPFYVSLKNNRSRVESLLRDLSLSDRLINVNGSIPSSHYINWDSVNKQLNTMRNNSLSYINNCINK